MKNENKRRGTKKIYKENKKTSYMELDKSLSRWWKVDWLNLKRSSLCQYQNNKQFVLYKFINEWIIIDFDICCS